MPLRPSGTGVTAVALTPLNGSGLGVLRTFLALASHDLSAYSVPSLMVWRDLFRYDWTVLGEHLCVFAEYDRNYYMPFPPLGPGAIGGAVDEAFALMESFNPSPGIARIENVPAGMVPEFERMGFRVREGFPEYLYRREELTALRGDRFKSKRWAVNAFRRNHKAFFEPYQVDDRQACLDLLTQWQALRAEKETGDGYGRALLRDALLAHRQALRHHEALGLTGRVVRIGGRVRAYTFGFELNPEVFCVLFEVADPQIKGLAQFVFWRFCEEMDGYAWINALDDSGLESLRRVKRSYHPARLVRSYSISKEEMQGS